MGKRVATQAVEAPPEEPNGCKRFRFVPDPRKPPEGWLYVTDLDGRLWVQGVGATHLQGWVLRAEPKNKKQRGTP